jgi:hypothetical protein
MDQLAAKNRELTGGECTCHRCHESRMDLIEDFAERLCQQIFIVCETCGNKRCPKATDHNLDCTGSNEPVQPGSLYE